MRSLLKVSCVTKIRTKKYSNVGRRRPAGRMSKSPTFHHSRKPEDGGTNISFSFMRKPVRETAKQVKIGLPLTSSGELRVRSSRGHYFSLSTSRYYFFQPYAWNILQNEIYKNKFGTLHNREFLKADSAERAHSLFCFIKINSHTYS